MGTNESINIADEIKSRCNIVDVIGRVVPLKKSGSNYKGLCPFHNEKTPSFVVSEEKQRFTCYGCDTYGDVIGFVELYYNLDFRGAAEMLAKEYGINTEGAFANSKDKDELYEINRQAARFFYKALREKENPGYSYMANRGISNDTLNKFGIGYADDEWDSLYSFLKSEDIPEDKMLELGLISGSDGKYFDRFRGRVIFPIMNTAGKVIGFGGRIIDEGEPKYLNSRESIVFQKKSNLYGLNISSDAVKKEDAIILVEGYMDAVSLYQSGIRNVSASLGTALTENQAKLIKRYTHNVILSYDSDDAGQNAAMRGIDVLYGEGCKTRVLKVTDGKDPDEFVKKNGMKAFKSLIDEAESYGDFKLNRVRSKYDLDDEQQRIDFMHDAVAVLRSMREVEADIYIKKLADETGISEGAIRYEYSEESNRDKDRADTAMRSGRAAYADDGNGADISSAEQEILKLMMIDERFMDIPDDFEGELFNSSAGKAVYDAIVKTDQETGGIRPLDEIRLRENADEYGERYIDMIEEMVISPGKEEKIFEEDIANIKKENMKKKAVEITNRISMADEDENPEDIDRLMKQLTEIQKLIKE